MANQLHMNGTSLTPTRYGRRVLDALIAGNENRADIVAAAVNDEGRWEEIKNGVAALTFPEVSRALGGLKSAGYEAAPPSGAKTGKGFFSRIFNSFSAEKETPFSKKEFYDFLRESPDAAETVRQKLHTLREVSKAKRGFLSAAFGIFSSEQPLEKITSDIETFAQYCIKNRITFEEKKGHFVEHEGFLRKNRFILAAVAGGLSGAAGLDLSAQSSAIGAYPGVFFGKMLPAFVVPFTALSLFKTASREDAAKDALLFARFGMTMTLGAALSIGIINAEEKMGLIGTHADAGTTAISQETGHGESEGFNPAGYMVDGVIGGAAGGIAYGMARHFRRRREGDEAGDNEFGIGKGLVKASNFMDRQFGDFVAAGGIPAIYLLLSHTIAKNGIGEFGHYGGLYATAFGSMGLAMGLLGAGLYKSGVRSKEDWKSVYSVAKQAFSTSSGAATIDTIKDSLKHFGVSEKTRDLTPLATAFHMFGPTVCLGSIALYANSYFGHPQTVPEQVQTLGLVIASMLAVRGVPTANGAMLTPILKKDGRLTESDISAVNAAVIGPDRLLDMCETVVNTTADLLVLKWHDNSKWAEKISKIKDAMPGITAANNEEPPKAEKTANNKKPPLGPPMC